MSTWADGYGRWYARVPRGSYDRAVAEILDELGVRGDTSPGYDLTLEVYTETEHATVYREAWA